MRFINVFRMNGMLIKCINCTFIVVVPKTDSPRRLNDFRPIPLVWFQSHSQIL